jgi:hypothetical protein
MREREAFLRKKGHEKVTRKYLAGAKHRPFDQAVNTFTVELENGRVEWNLDSECQKVVTPIATEFGMSVERFLTLYTRDRLPAQLVRGNGPDEDRAPAGFSVRQCKDASIRDRIRRAAQFAGFRSVKEFVWRSVMTSVNCCEDGMVLSPKTGRPVADALLLHRFIVSREHHPIDE